MKPFRIRLELDLTFEFFSVHLSAPLLKMRARLGGREVREKKKTISKLKKCSKNACLLCFLKWNKTCDIIWITGDKFWKTGFLFYAEYHSAKKKETWGLEK